MSRRPLRVGELLLRELGDLFGSGRVKDPAIGFITFTGVDMSPDLRQAQVFYSTLAEETGREETQAALDRARPFIRRELGRRLRLKVIPDVSFKLDATLEQAQRIEQLLQETKPKDSTVEDPNHEGGDPNEEARQR